MPAKAKNPVRRFPKNEAEFEHLLYHVEKFQKEAKTQALIRSDPRRTWLMTVSL